MKLCMWFAFAALLICGAIRWSESVIASPQSAPRSATQPASTQPGEQDATPAPTFDASRSDPKAIEVADWLLKAVGGMDAWKDVRYITWNYFGVRRLTWDRHTGDVRIESGQRTIDNDRGAVVLMNLNTKAGRGWSGGQEVLEEQQMIATLRNAYQVWEHDSYWVCMPFKLKDPGVILKYQGEGETKSGRKSDIIRVTFDNVGPAPQNMYDLWIAQDDHLVAQWAHFPRATDTWAEMVQPWSDWQKHGDVLISADRGELNGRPAKVTDIAVFESLPQSVFTNQQTIDWPAMIEDFAVRSE